MKKPGLIYQFVLAMAFIFASGSLWGQTNTWDGSSGANWNTAANWSLNQVPTTSHDVIIPNGITATITVNTAAVCNTFTMNGGGTANTVSISAGNSLTVTNGISIGAGTGSADNKILAAGTGSLSCSSITVAATTNSNRNSGITLSTGTITVSGNITMGDANDVFTFSGAGILYIGGTMTGGTFTASTGTVIYNGSAAQNLGTYNYYNLTVNNAAGVTLSAGVTVSNILTMTQGNITTGSNTLTLSNSTSANLSYTAGTIIGRFQRAIGSTGTEYLYPVGTASAYNPLKITFSNLTAGQMAVQFFPNDIGVTGLPLINDSGADIYDRQTTGYWTLAAVAPMASTNYSVNLNYSGFTGVDALARIIKRTNGGNLALNGTHGTVSGQEITRTALSGISTTTTDFAIGKPNPRFTTQPSNFSGCTASFSVAVSGRATLTYQWQENNGGGFTNISNGGLYSGANSNTLIISGATVPMNGYLYRCVVTDGLGYSATSSAATLSVILPVLTFGYNYSMDITLDPASGTSDLTDFPALISLTSSLLRTTGNGGHIYNSNGYDIIFTDNNGSILDHQIEYYVATTGQYVAWVRIPLLSQSASTTIRMYYGNQTVSVNPSVRSVWTSSYKGVWHLNGTDYTDATTNSNNGTNSNTTTVTGRIAGGRGFNGTTAYIGVPTNGFVPNDNNQTISIWANYSAAPSGNRNLISFQAGQTGSAIQLGFRGGNAVAWEWGGTILADGGTAPSTNTWHYYVYTYDGTTSRFFIDGVLMGSSTVAPQTLLPTEGNIGRYNNGEYIAANLDEPRFSMSPKSSGWILTEYNNQNDPAGFISLGTEVDATLLASVGVCSSTYPLNQGYPSGGVYSGTGVSGTNFNASLAGVGTHAITYFYTDAFGCSNSAIKNIVVTSLPAAPAASNKQSCISNIVDLEATGTNLKWYSDAGLTTLVGSGTPFATGRTTAGVYTYYVTQTINGCESAATTVSLTILNGITINTQPLPTAICTSGNGNFSVVATGYNMTYQWQENSGAGFNNITNGGIYSGATSATLTLTNPGIGKNGSLYRCVVSTSCGTSPVNSNSAVLTVTTLPVGTFSYTGTPYCPNAANPSPTFSGGGVAGTFSSTSGLVFVSTATGQVNIAASTPGSYTVTNTIAAAGGCGIVTATSPLTITVNLTWTGTISTNWNVAGNWSCGVIPGPATIVQIPNVANKPVLSAGAVAAVNNLTIAVGSSLTISGNTIQIGGTITNNGTFTATNGTVELNGSAAQLIGAGLFAGNTIKDLTINNNAGVTLQGPLNVTGIVTVSSGSLSSAGNLTLISTAAGTALISGSGTGTVAGNVTMQRYLSSGGYKYFSSPFQAATVNEFADDINLASPSITFYRYDENRLVGGLPATGWVNYKVTSNVLNPLAGYAVNCGLPAVTNTIDLTGVVNSGPISVPLYNHNQIYTNGFNLVGNPYPSPIDWDLVVGNNTNVDNAVYFFKASSTDQYGGSYSSYVNGIPSNGATNIIPSMQGFFVHISPSFPVEATLLMNNSVRVTDQTTPFTKSAYKGPVPLLRLTASFSDDTTSFDPVVIYFDEKATTDFDSQLDALKLFNTDAGVPNLYAVSSGGSNLSIDALPNIIGTPYTVPLGLKTNKNGEIIFKVRNLSLDFPDARIFLSDVSAGTETDIQPGKEYIVTLTAADYKNRFFINFSNIATAVPEIISGSKDPFIIYCSHGILNVEINELIADRGTLVLTNLEGRSLFTENIYSKGHFNFSPALKDGIYLASYITGKKRVSKKLLFLNR